MRGISCGPLLALGLAALPAVSIASCVPGAKPSYQDITAIYFRSEGVTEPVELHRGDLVRRGACPVSLVLYVSPSDVDKGSSPACLNGHLGELQPCCGASDSSTGDSPQLIFNRLVEVLVKDHFYDIADSSQPARSDAAGFYSIAVMRCDARPHDKSGGSMFVALAQARSKMSIVALSIPFGSMPEVTYGSKILTLFDDFTHAVYQSEWTPQDIW